jgi:predicted dehydrogenase
MISGRTLRVGVIGAGAFAEACHVPGIRSHPQAEVVALCGRRQESTGALAARLGIPDVHTDFRELCSRDDIDAITVATPNVAHAEQAVTALRAGKHVLCEKPLAMTVAEAREMVAAAEASRRVHQVAFTFRYNYGARELRRRVQAGDIGQPFYVRVQYDNWDGLRPDWRVGWREKQDIAGGGLLFDLGSHLFDIARFVLGPIELAAGLTHHIPRELIDAGTGRPTAIETDDLVAAWFRHAGGANGQFFVSRITPPFADNGCLEVIGPEGALKASLSRGKFESLKASRPAARDWADLPLPPAARDGQPHALAAMMRSFIDACLRGRIDTDLDATFLDGLAAQQAIAAVLESERSGRWVRLDDMR